MQFKPPGGELTFWSALWVLCGVACCVFGAMRNDATLYVLGALTGLPALGMWFDLRWCGYLFAIYAALMIPLGVWVLFAADDTLNERAYRLARIGMSAYFAYISFQWAQDE